MDSKTVTTMKVVFLAAALATAARLAMAAEAPSPIAALALEPIQKQVEYTVPNKEDAAQCTVRLERDGNTSNWVVTNRQGEVLRRFYDTNADNYVDMWCYYLGGIEVYRDIDSNFNNKADQYRWFNTAGTRWAVDKNEDGKIDSWKVITPQEVAEQVVLALKARDQARFELLLPTSSELSALGFGQSRGEGIAADVKGAPATFSKLLAEQKIVTPQTRYVDFGGARPGTIPAGTAGSSKDVTVLENATALVETGDKHEQVYLGTLVSVGNTWKLIDSPAAGSDHQPSGSGFMTASIAQTQAAPDGAPSEKLQKLMAELERLDKEGATLAGDKLAANIEQRVNTLQSLADVTPEIDRGQWYRQMCDVLGMAIQTGEYPQGAERLEQLQKKLADAKADEELIAHAAFQRMWANYAVAQRDPGAGGQVQAKWLADLQAFVTEFPKAPDTAEALFQLGMYQEFEGKTAEAAKSYQQLVSNFPKANQIEKASGALRRLNSLGKPISLRGTDIQGGSVDLTSPKYRGKAVLIHYWATMGERWKDDMVLLQNFYSKKGGANFDIIGVCLDDNPTEAKQYIAENKLPWKQLYEPKGLEGRLATEMGVITLPLMILVDQKGNVVNQNIHVAELDEALAKLTTPPAAETSNALRDAPESPTSR
jgi:hypothetical protein